MRVFLFVTLVLLLAGCGSSSSPGISPAGQTATATGPLHGTPGLTPNSTPGTPSSVSAVPTVVVGRSYSQFVDSLCSSLRRGDSGAVTNLLPYFQYNSGLRYGMLGDGAGQSTDPSSMQTWMRGAHIRCTYMTAGIAGHGVLLSRGWNFPGGWGLIEADQYPNGWRINDFTFGSRASLYRAMETDNPILRYPHHV